MKAAVHCFIVRIGAPLLAASAGATAAVALTKTDRGVPFSAYYALNEAPLPYRTAIMTGAAGLGISVLFLLARTILSMNPMRVDENSLPWWTASKPVIAITVVAALLCSVAQVFRE